MAVSPTIPALRRDLRDPPSSRWSQAAVGRPHEPELFKNQKFSRAALRRLDASKSPPPGGWGWVGAVGAEVA